MAVSWAILGIDRIRGFELAGDSLLTEVGVFKVEDDGEIEAGDGKVAHHLDEVGFVELGDDLRVDDDQSIDQQVWDEGVDLNFVVEYGKASLLFNAVASFS